MKHVAGMIFQTRFKSRVNSNKIADSGVVDHEVWKDKDRRWISGFTRHMMINNLPCKDIVWAYMRKEGADEGDDRQLSVNYLVIVTRRKKRYKFDMTEKEIHECIRILKILNPDMATGFRRAAGYLFIVCRIPEIWVRSLQLMTDTSCRGGF